MQIRSAVHEILADEAFTATDGLISQSFVVAFAPPAYVRIALVWGFPVQLSLSKQVHWLWRYKLNEVCDRKKFIVEYNIWEREEDLENTKEVVAEFNEKLNAEVRQ